MIFNNLRDRVLEASSFLEATANRVRAGNITITEIADRCTDTVGLLRGAEKTYAEEYYAVISETVE